MLVEGVSGSEKMKMRRVWRGSAKKSKYGQCKCDLCTKWSPLHRRIMAKLRGKDRKLFDEYLMMNASDSDDLGAANAKLAGEWPGWEWMKDEIVAYTACPGTRNT